MRSEGISGTLASITDVTGVVLDPGSWASVSGGDINQAAKLRDVEGRSWFIKLNTVERLGMFAAEGAGLSALADADDIRVPEVAGYGNSDQFAWLMLEWLDLTGSQQAADRQLGQSLARMHRLTAANFGWHRDNYIGRTVQTNTQNSDWPEFFREQRLAYQLSLARENGAPASLIDSGNQLMARLDDWFADYIPDASLLHGDLWGGNRGALPDGSPALFDPAVYFGDRETDIAMTQLFGGFGREFYDAYVKEWPLDKGAERRQPLYNLYHVLNHFNLFGTSYLMQAEQMLQRLLAE